jgi:sucrose-6-phosphate hydrolase SacC (GH32 family)
MGIRLAGKERKASLVRGGDGYAAQFNGGWLDAGQGADGELQMSGNAMTVAIRLRDPSGKWGCQLLGKRGGLTNEAYNLFSADLDEGLGLALAAEIGSDEVAGVFRVRTSISQIGATDWHDVIVRFDGHALQLFVDGSLHDDEVAVGTLRQGNREPCLIGDAAPSSGNEARAAFRGLVDHVALWNRAIPDHQIAELSGVRKLGDRRPRYYYEKYRPQFHFSAQKHWINDPNGLVYYKGTYHLFFQHLPPGRPAAYKDWGHAVSEDLVHWRQVPSPITPHKIWGGCWTGSAVVDGQNTSGFKKGEEAPVVAILTNGGTPGQGPPCTQCIAYSNDSGATFTYYENNPVLGHLVAENRDPKVIWHAPTNRWIMALYLDKNDYALFGSPDLKHWDRICDLDLPGVAECPGLVELPLDGNTGNTRWVFWGGNGNYVIGSFDGRTFRKQSDVLVSDYGKNFYAAQTWSDIPAQDGRTLHIAWMNGGKYPGMPFTQQMNFPTEVTLRTTKDGIRMHRVPAREISKLHAGWGQWKNEVLEPDSNLFENISGDLFDIRVEVDPVKVAAFGLKIRGESVRYSVAEKTIACLGSTAPLVPENARIKLQVLVDRTSLEVFGNDGRAVLTSCFLPPEEKTNLEIFVEDGAANLISAEVYQLQSIWA